MKVSAPIGLLFLLACRATEPRPVTNVAPPAPRDPCDMVEAMLAIESEAYQQIYSDGRLRRMEWLVANVHRRRASDAREARTPA